MTRSGFYEKDDHHYSSDDGETRIGTVLNKILYIDLFNEANRSKLQSDRSLTVDWLTISINDECNMLECKSTKNETEEDRIAVIEGFDKNDINYVIAVRNLCKNNNIKNI